MATALAHPSLSAKSARTLPGRRFDHFFFSGMALLMLATVFVGFAPTYYLAGVFRAPLPSPIIHVHGALFSCWILLLVTQTFAGLRGPRRYSPAPGDCRIPLGLSHGHRWHLGCDGQAGAGNRSPELRSVFFLHHSNNGHADFCDPGLFR